MASRIDNAQGQAGTRLPCHAFRPLSSRCGKVLALNPPPSTRHRPVEVLNSATSCPNGSVQGMNRPVSMRTAVVEGLSGDRRARVMRACASNHGGCPCRGVPRTGAPDCPRCSRANGCSGSRGSPCGVSHAVERGALSARAARRRARAHATPLRRPARARAPARDGSARPLAARTSADAARPAAA